MKLQFLGAVKNVTGSKFLITTKKGTKILLDCGMYQGKGLETDAMNRDLGFEPTEIDYLILSHAHIDHSGLIPYIYKLGFRGTVICTPATRDLCSIMLPDSGKIQESDVRTFNKKTSRQNMQPIEPIYTTADAVKCMECFITVSYNRDYNVNDHVTVRFTDTGHILGSSAVNLTIKEGRRKIRLCYTGDIGRYDKHILRDPEAFPQADYIITESTYGDRVHSKLVDAENDLLRVVMETCVEKKGKLIIPSFAIGRTQEIIFTFDRLHRQQRLPDVKMYVDSPLAISATDIFRLHTECFNEKMIAYMQNEDADPFGFEKLHYIRTIEQSKQLNTDDRPCVIISASGMMEAGRVKHHLFNHIEDRKCTILTVGYCAPSTLGAKILRGDRWVSIFGTKKQVKADVRSIESLSGHGDYREMSQFLSCQDKKKIKKIFLVHGEEEVQIHYREHLKEQGFKHIEIPSLKDEVEL